MNSSTDIKAYRWPTTTFMLGVLELIVPYLRIRHMLIASNGIIPLEIVIGIVLSIFPLLQIFYAVVIFVRLSMNKQIPPFFLLWNAAIVVVSILILLLYFLISGALSLLLR